jgi:ribose transport system permease protein
MRLTDATTAVRAMKFHAIPFQLRLAMGAVGATAALVGVLAIGSLINPAFLTFENLLLVVRAASITGMVALGMAFVTISGNLFALSGEQTATLAAVVFAILMSHGFGFAASFIVTLGFGALLGLLQAGVVVAGANPIIATLAFGALFEGFATLLSGNGYVAFSPSATAGLGTGRPFGIPTQSWAFVILTIVAAVLIRKTRIGRLLTLAGANRDTARSSGLKTSSATLFSLTTFAVASAFVGVLTAAQFSLAKPTLFEGLNINVIAAVLVGGIALKGGRGSPAQAALGAMFIALAQNLMLLNGVTTGVRMLVVGAFVIASIAIFQLVSGPRR